MKDYSIMLATLLLTLVAAGSVFADLNDVDQADTSDTSSTGGQDNNMEGSEGTDPNLLNPQKGQGYGHMDNPWKTTMVRYIYDFTCINYFSLAEIYEDILSKIYLE